jgi:hypothetical protein
MAKMGIHRFVIELGPGLVKVRAQSKSPRGTSFTVRGVKVPVTGSERADLKKAARRALLELWPDNTRESG